MRWVKFSKMRTLVTWQKWFNGIGKTLKIAGKLPEWEYVRIAIRIGFVTCVHRSQVTNKSEYLNMIQFDIDKHLTKKQQQQQKTHNPTPLNPGCYFSVSIT